ncbi:MAG: NAD(P)-binding oxidoreductase [Gaiellaceae bacterium]
MRLLVLGANGKTGRQVVERALEAGHAVTAFVRNPAAFRLSHENLAVASGDAYRVDDLVAALKGQEAVVNTIGGGERRLIENTTRVLVEAMRTSGVKRIVAMSSFIATPNFKPTGMMRLFPRLVKGMAGDDLAGVKILERSGLDWTIVFATVLENKPRAGYHLVGLDEIVTAKNSVNRADVATCLLDALADRDTIRQSLIITGR